MFSITYIDRLKIVRLVGAITSVFLYFNNSKMYERRLLGTQRFVIK